MKKWNILCGIMMTCLAITGCAIGNQYDYRNKEIALPVTGNSQVGLAVVDNRPYVVSGDKPANYVGIQRGGFGNPFNVTTISGDSLANDFAGSLKSALSKNGFEVNSLQLSSPDSSVVANLVKSNGSSKNIILKVNEWKTDAMMNLRLIYDLELAIMDKQGNVLATASDSGDEVISGAGFESGNARNVTSSFETKISRLFNTSTILTSLNH